MYSRSATRTATVPDLSILIRYFSYTRSEKFLSYFIAKRYILSFIQNKRKGIRVPFSFSVPNCKNACARVTSVGHRQIHVVSLQRDYTSCKGKIIPAKAFFLISIIKSASMHVNRVSKILFRSLATLYPEKIKRHRKNVRQQRIVCHLFTTLTCTWNQFHKPRTY